MCAHPTHVPSSVYHSLQSKDHTHTKKPKVALACSQCFLEYQLNDTKPRLCYIKLKQRYSPCASDITFLSLSLSYKIGGKLFYSSQGFFFIPAFFNYNWHPINRTCLKCTSQSILRYIYPRETIPTIKTMNTSIHLKKSSYTLKKKFLPLTPPYSPHLLHATTILYISLHFPRIFYR